jgi:hypothetical protein
LTGGQLTGNLTFSGSQTVDGRDVSADGTKLDGIEASADVTDTTNVVAALTAGTGITIAGNGTIASTASSDLVDDTSPQLGGDLQTNGNDIDFADNDKAIFGAGSDLQISHTGSHSQIVDSGTGGLFIGGSSQIGLMNAALNEYMVNAAENGAVTLYHDNSAKIATASGGVTVTGDIANASGNMTIDIAGDLNLDADGGNVLFKDGGTEIGRLSNSSSNLDIRSSVSNKDMFFTVNGSERMRLTSAGRLGLGISSPSAGLHVEDDNGAIISRSGYSQYLQLQPANNSVPTILGVGGNGVHIGPTNSTGIRINNSGSVGIGTVPLAKFHVNSTNSAFYMGYGGNEDIYLQTTNGNVLFTNKGATTERMRLTSAGLLGLGTSAPSKLMHLSAGNDSASLRLENTANSKVWEITPANPGVTNSGLSIYNVTDDAVALHVDNSNNVGIGTSPSKTLDVAGDAQISGQVLAQFFTGVGDTDTYMDISSNPANTIKFYTGGSERGRFSATGNLLLGQSSTDTPGTGNTTTGTSLRGLGDGFFSRSNGEALYLNRNNDGGMISIRRSNSQVGVISVTTSGTTYTTTSDIRLKQDIEPLEATDKLMQMNPVSYSWKADPDGPRSMGFIAQEMRSVMPEAVSTGDDDMMSMDYGRITPILVSALQDAHRKIEQLEQRIADMEAK